jgi:acyl dehydratase
MIDFRIATARQYIGKELFVSDWTVITQEMVTGFATATLDPDWMHVDVERSRRESPYGGTIVQGFLMQSLIIYFTHVAELQPSDTAYGLNYGMDKVRFLAPVPTGSRVRDRITLTDFQERSPGRYLHKSTHTIELEGSDKPAVVADWLVLWFKDLKH